MSHIGIGVAALVIHNDALLMVQRMGKHGDGLWCPPGGWIDPRVHGDAVESPGQAAVRETYEETGVTVVPSQSDDVLYPLTWPTVDGVQSYCVWVPCTYKRGEPALVEPDKAYEVRWVPLPEVRGLSLFPHMQWFIWYHWPTLP